MQDLSSSICLFYPIILLQSSVYKKPFSFMADLWSLKFDIPGI